MLFLCQVVSTNNTQILRGEPPVCAVFAVTCILVRIKNVSETCQYE